MKKFFSSFLLILILSFPVSKTAFADVLTPCINSPLFTKRMENSIKKLESRIKKYDSGSAPALALEKQIDRTKLRFDRYGKSNLLCGPDGLPHLVTSGQWDHAAEFTIPGLMFLYTTGWIGWSGRRYLKAMGANANSAEKEIIIDVPIALNIMISGFSWPLSAWQELVSGELLASSEEITVSPR